MRHLGYVLKRFPRISETFIAAELIEMCRQGERVTVFAVSRPEEPFVHRFLDELDVEVVYLPHRPWREPLRVLSGLARVVTAAPGGFIAALRHGLNPPRLRSWRHTLQAAVLARELADRGITHIHAHFASTAARLAYLAWRMGGPPYSVTAHAKDIYHDSVDPVRLRQKLASARFVATVCEGNRRYLKEVLGFRAPVHLVPNSVDLSRLPDPLQRWPEPGLVLTVARLVEKKGLDDLVRAVGILAGRGKDVRLEVVGDGPLRGDLEALSRVIGAPVEFRGPLQHEEAVARYPRAAVFALPCVVASTGDRDGSPTSVLEAMAAAVPVVTTSVNGLAEIVIDGRTGLVVPQRDPEALAGAIGRLLADPILADGLGVAGRATVEAGFSLSRSVGKLRSLISEVET